MLADKQVPYFDMLILLLMWSGGFGQVKAHRNYLVRFRERSYFGSQRLWTQTLVSTVWLLQQYQSTQYFYFLLSV